MTRPPRLDADLITGLRRRAVTHNGVYPQAPAKLNDLKKAWILGWRRSRGSPVGAEAYVTKHLQKLAAIAASAQSINALAKASFDETDHRRDEDGKFAPKGGGAPSSFASVRTPQQHQQARDENAGYRASSNQVIQETRGTEFGPGLGLAAGVGLGAVRGARADKMPGKMLRAAHSVGAGMAGRAVGAAAGAGRAAGERISNRMRRAAGEPEVPVMEAAGATREATARFVRRGVKRALDVGTKASLFMPKAIIAGAKSDAGQAGLTGAARRLFMLNARLRAASAGAILPGALVGLAGWKAGQIAGPAYDAMFPRTVQKLAADPRSVEVLSKRLNPLAGLRAIGARIAGMARKPVAAAATRAPGKGSFASAEAIGRRVGGMAARVRLKAQRRSVGVGAALGGAAGAGLGLAGAMAGRKFYRDKDGKFTSKDRDVSSTLGMAAAGLAAGALAGAAFVRGRNLAGARRIAARVGETMVQVPAKEKGKFETITLAQAKQLMGARRGGLKASDIKIVPKSGGDDFGGYASRLRDKAAKKFKSAVGDEQGVLAARASLIRQANGDWDAWQEFQVDHALRSKLASLASHEAFAAPKAAAGAPKPADPNVALRRLLGTMPTEISAKTSVGGRVASTNDPVGDLINHARAVAVAKKAKRPGPGAHQVYDSLTAAQRTEIHAAVARADATLGNFKAKFATHEKLVGDAMAARSQRDIAANKVRMASEAGKAKAEAALKNADDTLEAALTAAKASGSKLPVADNPFGTGKLLPQLGHVKDEALGATTTLSDFIEKDAKAFSRASGAQKAAMERADTQARSAALAYLNTAEQAGRRSSANNAARRAAAPVTRAAGRFGRQAKMIVGDAREATAPRAQAAWAAAKRAQSTIFEKGQKIGDGVKEHVLKPLKTWAETSPRSFYSISSMLGVGVAGGIVDVSADGELDFRFNRIPDAAKHLIDKQSRPKAKMLWLNGGKDVAYVMVGKTKPRKGQEATEIILSGKIIKDRGDNQATQIVTITPMTPLRTFTQGNQGGGGGNRGVQLPSEVTKAAADAIGSLRRDSKLKRAGDDEDGYEFRDKDDNSQQNPAREYLNGVMKAAGSSRGGEGFYGYLASVFNENGAILQEREKRAAIFGRKKDGKAQNDGLINGGDAFDGYHNQNPDKLFSGLKQRIEGLPAPNDAQAGLLNHMVTLASRAGNVLPPAKASELRTLIDKRRSGESAEGASASPGKSEGQPPKYDFSPPAKSMQWAQDEIAKHALHVWVAEGNPEKDFTAASARFAQVMLAAEMDKMRAEQERGSDFGDEKSFMRTAVNRTKREWPVLKAVSLADLAKASVALLAKAEIPQGGQRRPFEETKFHRNPKGDDRGGEFAPKGGGRSPSPGRKAVGAKPAAPERGYFEPVRFGGTVGGAAGGQAMFEIASRFLPGPLRNAGMVGRLAYRMGAAAAGSIAGEAGGEALGREAYGNPSKAPAHFEPPPRSLGEEAVRMAGSTGGALLGAVSRRPMSAFAIGLGGQLAGEELAAAAHNVIARHYGQEVAARAARASMPRSAAA